MKRLATAAVVAVLTLALAPTAQAVEYPSSWSCRMSEAGSSMTCTVRTHVKAGSKARARAAGVVKVTAALGTITPARFACYAPKAVNTSGRHYRVTVLCNTVDPAAYMD